MPQTSKKTDPADTDLQKAVTTILSNGGQTLAELSADHPLLVVFLRHSGCTFCREALSDVAEVRLKIQQHGTGIAFVHMSTPERATGLFKQYGLADLPRFSDPDQHLYRAFELKNGSFQQLLGPRVLWEGFQAALFRGHGFGLIDGNGLRLPGVFLLQQGRIIAASRLRTAAERPDYLQMACETNLSLPDQFSAS